MYENTRSLSVETFLVTKLFKSSLNMSAFENWLTQHNINIPPILKKKLEENYIASAYALLIINLIPVICVTTLTSLTT